MRRHLHLEEEVARTVRPGCRPRPGRGRAPGSRSGRRGESSPSPASSPRPGRCRRTGRRAGPPCRCRRRSGRCWSSTAGRGPGGSSPSPCTSEQVSGLPKCPEPLHFGHLPGRVMDRLRSVPVTASRSDSRTWVWRSSPRAGPSGSSRPKRSSMPPEPPLPAGCGRGPRGGPRCRSPRRPACRPESPRRRPRRARRRPGTRERPRPSSGRSPASRRPRRTRRTSSASRNWTAPRRRRSLA